MCAERKSLGRCQARRELEYRIPARVTELYINPNGDGYYICPKCRSTLEREFSAYCDRCGQCLNWAHYKKAARVYAKPFHAVK